MSQAESGPVRTDQESQGRGLSEEFDRAADRYDLLTRLNPGYHGALRRAAGDLVQRLRDETCRRSGAKRVARQGPSVSPVPLRLWDLGSGSGLSTRALLDAAGPDARIVGLDASAGMLARARAKQWPAGVRFVQALAQDLPRVAEELPEVAQGQHTSTDRAPDGLADGAFAAYLMRNVPEDQRDAVVAAIRDQVRPGGWITLQDYHVKGDRRASAVWTAVCWGVVTPLAFVVRGNPTIYRYLWRSVRANDSTTDLQGRLERAGLTEITWRTAGGWQRGILHTVLARRPEGEQP